MKTYSRSDIIPLKNPPDKNVVLKTMFGTEKVSEDAITESIFSQMLQARPSKITFHNKKSSGLVFGSDTDWFLDESTLKSALNGYYIGDIDAGANSLRVETCLSHVFGCGVFVDSSGNSIAAFGDLRASEIATDLILGNWHLFLMGFKGN